MASSSSSQRNQERNAFSGIEPAGRRRRVCESSRLFDVFINHRGPDVKQTLATQPYDSLEQLGIRTFLDSQERELGNSFTSTIENAIRSASVHIAIFSKRYAESAWCLTELLLMLESKAKIIPVFYEVEPWELRYIEKGVYAEAFIKYEEKGRYLEKLSEWKEALQSLSFTAGEVFNSFSYWDCQKIVAAVQKEVQKKTHLHVADYPVGLNNLVEDFEKRCLDDLVQDFENQCGLEEGKNMAKVVGIFGMGGAGKTTLAKELFNRKKRNYNRASFLFDVREASGRRELPSLQHQLLKDIFREDLSFRSIEEGTSHLKDYLKKNPSLSFLIVVDDIDHVEQLNALQVMAVLDRSCNSLVIVTTRDVGVLITAGVTAGYNLKGMDTNYGRELFCWHAFGRPHPDSGYETLVNSFVELCGGLPLSLQVLGRHVHGRTEDYWSLEMIKVRKTLPQDVKQRLKISFDALDAEEKQVFLDIACFFTGKPKSIAEMVLGGSGWNAQHALETLKDKCLVEEVRSGYWDWEVEEIGLRMHDHLRDLGRELPLEFNPPHRLWRPQDLKSLVCLLPLQISPQYCNIPNIILLLLHKQKSEHALCMQESMSFKTILAITDVRCCHSIFNKSMDSKVTFFLGQSNNRFETSGSLLWLELEGNFTEEPSIPSWIPLQNLQCLKIKGGRLKTLWKNNIQALSQLKKLQISQTVLKVLPSLSRLSCLEKIEIDSCEKLQNITLPTSFIMLRVRSCRHLQIITGTGDLTKLMILIIQQCPELEKLPNLSSQATPQLKDLQIFQTSLKEFPELLGVSKDSLENVFLEDRGKSRSVETPMSGLEKLEIIEIRGEKFVSKVLISGIHYPSLKSIKLHAMEYLMEVNLTSVKTLSCLEIKNCKKLKRLTGTSDLTNLVLLSISDCPDLEFENLRLWGMKCLESIEIDGGVKVKYFELDGCQVLRTLKFGCEELVELIIRGCPELKKLRYFEGPSCVERIIIDGCGKLESIEIDGGVKVKYFELDGCQVLRTLKFGCEELVIIRGCPELKKLPYFEGPSCVERIIIDGCGKLECFQSRGCQNLRSVTVNFGLTKFIYDCPELEGLTSLTRLGLFKQIVIDSSEKLQNIAGIEEVQTSLTLNYCNNTTTRNCIHNLKSVPSRLLVSGRAVDGAESSLNEYLFSDAHIGIDGVIDISADETYYSKWQELSAVIGCCVVVVDSSTSVQRINKSLSPYNYEYSLKVREGEWIITMVARRRYSYYVLKEIEDILRRKGIMKKGFRVEVKKGEDWKCLRVLHIIMSGLYRG